MRVDDVPHRPTFEQKIGIRNFEVAVGSSYSRQCLLDVTEHIRWIGQMFQHMTPTDKIRFDIRILSGIKIGAERYIVGCRTGRYVAGIESLFLDYGHLDIGREENLRCHIQPRQLPCREARIAW